MHLQPSHKSDLQSAHFQNRQQKLTAPIQYLTKCEIWSHFLFFS